MSGRRTVRLPVPVAEQIRADAGTKAAVPLLLGKAVLHLVDCAHDVAAPAAEPGEPTVYLDVPLPIWDRLRHVAQTRGEKTTPLLKAAALHHVACPERTAA